MTARIRSASSSTMDAYFDNALGSWEDIAAQAADIEDALVSLKETFEREVREMHERDIALDALERAIEHIRPLASLHGRSTDAFKEGLFELDEMVSAGPAFGNMVGVVGDGIDEAHMVLNSVGLDRDAQIAAQANDMLVGMKREIKEVRRSYNVDDFQSWLNRTSAARHTTSRRHRCDACGRTFRR